MKKTGKKPKKSGGRPALPPDKRRSKRLDDVRFSPEELADYKARAAKSGLRWSDWVRERLAC